MADETRPLGGAHDPDREVIARLVDEARPRGEIPPPSPDDVEAALRAVLARRDPQDAGGDPPVVPIERHRAASPSRFVRRIAVAAAALFVVAGAGLLWRSTARPIQRLQTSSVPRQFVTPAGKVSYFVLPDSTRVVLGPRSVLTVDASYGATNRVVSLRGDGYFDVVHQADRPFVVRTPYAELVDVGTAFSVRDAGQLGVQVSVASGRVAARAAGVARGDTATLGPSDQAMVQPDGRIRVDSGSATPDDHAWTQGRLVFRDAPMEFVAAELRRWYGLDLRIYDPTLRSRRLTATFDRAAPSDVGPVIAAALGGVARQTGDTLYLSPTAGGARRR